MSSWQNPVLRGFHPDPSVAVVGEDIYLATSTFEWFPGVRIYHSRDLANWDLVATPLDHPRLLDLRGVPDSCGVWAPCLSHDGEKFHLVYSVVRSFDGVWKDTPNYVTTAASIEGPWSDPVFLSSSGFDGSLFHDRDGRKWYTSMLVDHRGGKFFGGIILQEYNAIEQRLVGPVHHIFEGTVLGKTEGPHIYHIGDWYYLVTAEGGTEYGHAVSVARSRNITGPYEVHPENPLFSSAESENAPLQKVGHGDLFQMPDGSWNMAVLVARPIPGTKRCTLGRETAIVPIEWRDEWPVNLHGMLPQENVGDQSAEYVGIHEYADLRTQDLPQTYQSLRVPKEDSWYRQNERGLRLYGRDSLTSTFDQSLLARRVQHFNIEFTAGITFNPASFQHMAGVVCYYNTSHFYYCMLTGNEENGGTWLQIVQCDNNRYYDLLTTQLKLPNVPIHYLRVVWEYDKLSFQHSADGRFFSDIGIPWDASILSDDYVRDGSPTYRPAFTGSFVGVCCQDLTGSKRPADIIELSYREIYD